MKYLVLLAVLSVVAPVLLAVKLQPFYKKCKRSDPELNECIRKNANEGMPMFSLGDSRYHIPSLLPLHIDYLRLDANGLVINIYNATFEGLEKSVFEVLNIDLEKKSFHMIFKLPKLMALGQYDAMGKILILPITGEGPGNITLDNVRVTYNVDYDLQEIKGKEYMIPKNGKFTFETTRAYFRLDNLFNGDKRLGEEMNKFLDESWKEVHEELGPTLGDAMEIAFTQIMGYYTKKVPFSEFFED